MKKTTKLIRIEIAGVYRCCVDSVGGTFKDKEDPNSFIPFEDPKDGDEDYCKYCNRKFKLIDSIWTPISYYGLSDYNE